MKNEFNPLPLHNQLTAWHNAEITRRRFRSTLEQARVGDSTDNPVNLPDSVAKQSAAERCRWALKQLDEERKSAAASRREQQLGEALRAKLSEIKLKKHAEEQAITRKRLRRVALVTAVFAALGVIAVTVWWQRRPPSISKASVEKVLMHELGKHGLTLSSVSFQTSAKHGGIADVYANLTAKLTHPLYVSVPAEKPLQDEFKLDAVVNKRIAELTSAKEGPRLLELAALPSRPPDLTKVSLVKLGTPAGNTFNGMAGLTASQSSGHWEVAVRSISVPGLLMNQRPREQFPGDVFDISRDDDRARLRALVDEQPKILARLEKARGTYVAEVMVQHKQQEVTLIPLFRPGTIFTGTLPGRTANDKKPIYLEVTEAAGGSGVHPLKAIVHNDGGWGDGRLFEGEWKFELARERFELSLVSRSDKAIGYGGPILDDPKMINLQLAIEADRLSGQYGTLPLQLTRVPDADTDRVKRSASPDYFAMLEAMVPDAFYLGAVKLSETNTQQILLRFTRAANGSTPAEAVLQDPEREAWQFKLAGPLIGNRHREANWPLRLAEVRDSMPPAIPVKSFVLQFRALALRMENGVLMGDYRNRPFRFERLSSDETARRLRATTAWRQAFSSAIRPGGVIDGTAVDPTKAIRSQLRLRILTVDSAKAAIEARLESIQNPALFRTVSGKIFAEAGTLNLAFDVRPNTYGLARTAAEPWFKGGRDALTLAVNAMALTGQDGYTWNFEFPLGIR